CTFRSVSIGQGEVDVTPLQVANEMAYIANNGWYITPHVVDSIDGGDKTGILEQYRKRHNAMDIPDSIFEVVHDGMQGVVERGTGGGAKVAGVVVCGKTGTVENYYRGVKQPNHAFFCGFAPRDNPKIAIMCVVENSGRFGGTYAAPIVGLMIEKYLKDSITDKKRLADIDRLSKLNLIPPRIGIEIRKQDSIRHSKDSAYLSAKGYIKIIKDTVGIDDGDNEDEINRLTTDTTKKENKKKDSTNRKLETPAIIPDNKKKPATADSITTTGR
ncbi:MAG: penicillin-binding transpeptidase domain-containing protein, partial [Ferruginibacter sp.]